MLQVFELLSPNIFLPLKVLSDLVISYPKKDNCPFEFGVFTFLLNFGPFLLNNKLKKISTQTVHPSFPSAMSKTRLAPPPCQLLSRSSTTSLSHRCPIIQAPDLTPPPFVRCTEVTGGSSGIPLESLPPALLLPSLCVVLAPLKVMTRHSLLCSLQQDHPPHCLKPVLKLGSNPHLQDKKFSISSISYQKSLKTACPEKSYPIFPASLPHWSSQTRQGGLFSLPSHVPRFPLLDLCSW